ncbi:hypothetical protein HYV10_00845 [Candidatus Dependentiae bacterium]|nr:hypothetical protein [Candidatus Dependentiae bacterium]
MNKLFIYAIAIVLFVFGILFFSYQESWIIVNIPQNTEFIKLSKPEIKESPIQVWIFKKEKWISETRQIIKDNNTAQTLYNLLNSWFAFLEEEQIINQTITVHSVTLSPTNSLAFISLNQNPFMSQASTYEIMMLIEGMLKTIRENKIPLQAIQLLVQHRQIIDHRLNFSISWPITGYIES